MSWVFGPSCLETPGITDDKAFKRSAALKLKFKDVGSAFLRQQETYSCFVTDVCHYVLYARMPHLRKTVCTRNFQMPLLIGKRYVCTVCAQHTIS